MRPPESRLPQAPTTRGRAALAAVLTELQGGLQRLFRQRTQAPQDGPGAALQGQLLLGLELLWKIEQQVVLPALHRAGALGATAAADELELMRDLAQLAGMTSGSSCELTLSVLEGMAMLHFARVNEALLAAPADGAPWGGLAHEVRELLARWHAEMREHGEIEDEERDPVGLPPR